MKICHVKINNYLINAIKATGQFRCHCGSITEVRFFDNKLHEAMVVNEFNKIKQQRSKPALAGIKLTNKELIMSTNRLTFADEDPNEEITEIFKWIEKETAKIAMQYHNKELSPHELLSYFWHLQLKSNSGLSYSKQIILRREMNRLEQL